jgi:competence protein ComEC
MLISGGFLLVKAILILRGRNEVFQFNLKPILLIFIGTLVLGLADAGYWYYQRHWRTTLRVTILDVGNGSANLVEFPNGKVMLIDGGGFTDNTLFDVGRAIVAPVLWFKRIKKIDYLVLTHPNSDHLNGLIFIARHFNIGEVWQTGWEYNTLGYHQFQQILAQRNLSVPVWIDLPKKQQIKNVTVDLMWPPQEPDIPQIWPDTNNQSLVIKMTLGAHSIMFPGDVERPVEMALIRKYGAQLYSTVLLAPHHGSRTSSSQLFLEAVLPRLVIVSSAPYGRYPFPHPVIRQRYERLGVEILETANQGAITIDFKKEGFLVRKEKTPLERK